jgi:hypothetical protein
MLEIALVKLPPPPETGMLSHASGTVPKGCVESFDEQMVARSDRVGPEPIVRTFNQPQKGLDITWSYELANSLVCNR